MQLKDFDFRLWHKPSESFVEIRGSFLTANAKDEIVFEKSLIVPIDDENIEIEIWSGLCDKKGERIYEGDILAHDNGYGIEYHSKVIFENGVFKIAVIEHPAVEIIEGLGTGFVAVVGNIHENADLLEKERGLIMRIECKYEDIYDSKGFPKY